VTTTTAETLTVNGVVLNTLAKNIQSLTGRLRAPGLRTENVTVPGRHGTVWVPNKRYEEGQVILPMWVKGSDDDENILGRDIFFSNVDTLTQLFRPGAGRLEVIHTLPDGSQRRCFAECTEAINMTMTAGGEYPYATFSVALRIPGVFWEDVTPVVVNLTHSYTGEVGALAGTTAPIEDATFKIEGPCLSATVEARYNGGALDDPLYFTYSGIIGTGQSLTVDCSNWKLTGAGGLVVDYTKLFHTGSARFMTIAPGPVGGAPELKVTMSNPTQFTSNVRVTARRKYLVG
jgi:hypothetical protein